MLFERSGPQASFWRAASGTPSCTGQICRKESTRNRVERRKPTRHAGVCVCACVCTCVRALVRVYVEVCILITRDAALGQPGEQQCKWEAASNQCGDRGATFPLSQDTPAGKAAAPAPQVPQTHQMDY